MENIRVIKRAGFTLCAFIFLFFLSVPAFAESDNSIQFSPLPVTSASAASVFSDGLVAISPWVSSTMYQIAFGSAEDPGIITFAYKSSDSPYPTYQFIAVSQNAATYYFADNQSQSNLYFSEETTRYNETYGFYTNAKWRYIASSQTIHVPVYDDMDSGMAAAAAYFQASSVTPHALQFTLPAGNIFIANVSGVESSITLGMHTPLLSWNPPVSQYMGTFSSIPSDLTLPITGTSPINWRSAGKKDILGRSSNWIADDFVSNQNFVIITNPLNQDASQYSSNSNNLEVSAANADITINMSSVVEYRVYSLSQVFNISSGDWHVSQGTESFSGSFDDATQTWVTINDNTGDFGTPSYGGDNTPVVPNSISDWLENIASSISGFFKGAIGAVSTLVASGSAFFNVLAGLYSWLPPAVYGVLCSALIIVITIGVVKVFI